MTYSDDVRALSLQHPALAEGLYDATNLDRVFRFLESQGFTLSLTDFTAQDEFSHDVCFPFPESGNFLVFGVT